MIRFPFLSSSCFLLSLCLPALADAAPKAAQQPSTTNPPSQCIAWGDFDQDEEAAPDRLILDLCGLQLWLGHEEQSRPSSDRLCLKFQAYAQATRRAIACDVDQDGWTDLLLAGPSCEPIAYFRNLGRTSGRMGEWLGFANAPLSNLPSMLR